MKQCVGMLGIAAISACVDPMASGTVDQAIDGGQVAASADFPTVVAIEHVTGIPFCTGTLIDPAWVMTAAHCVTDFDAGDLQVIFDDDDVLDLHDGPSSAVAAVHVHPSYDANVLDHDIALLQLATPKTDRAATPAARSDVPLNTQLTTLGYGLSDTLAGAGVLHSLVTYNVDCALAGDARATDATLMCFDHSHGAGTDTGDSGGPAFLDAGGARTVVALTSDGIGNYDTNTLVPHELPFIDQYVPHAAGSAGGSGDPGTSGGSGATTAPGMTRSGGCSASSNGSLALGLILAGGACARGRRRARPSRGSIAAG